MRSHFTTNDEARRDAELTNLSGQTCVGHPVSGALNLQLRRQDFERWLRRHRQLARKMSLPALIQRYGGGITVASAYRVAVGIGVRGTRHNITRYVEFWEGLNWALPDRVLHRIWGVSRQSLRQRRLRLGVGRPAFDVPRVPIGQRYAATVAREQAKAATCKAPRPH